jgi:hypothetical protein
MTEKRPSIKDINPDRFRRNPGDEKPQRRRKNKVYKDKIMKIAEDMDLQKMKDKVDAIAGAMGTGVLGGVAGAMGKKMKKDFDDGGVVDMTTEVDVE